MLTQGLPEEGHVAPAKHLLSVESYEPDWQEGAAWHIVPF